MDNRQINLINLRKLIDERFSGNKAAFARDLGVAPNVVSRWFADTKKDNSRAISRSYARKIEEKHGLEEGWMDILHYQNYDTGKRIAEESPTAWSSKNERRIPIMTISALANKLKEAINPTEDTKDTIPVSQSLQLAYNAYAIIMEGDMMTSMSGKSIPHNAQVYINPVTDLPNGRVAVVYDQENSTILIKQLIIDGPNKYLRSFNPDYKPILMTEQHQIIGEVVKAFTESFSL